VVTCRPAVKINFAFSLLSLKFCNLISIIFFSLFYKMAGTSTTTMQMAGTNGVPQPTKDDTNVGTLSTFFQGLLQSVTPSASKGKLKKIKNESYFTNAHSLFPELCSEANSYESSSMW
jgi:hypothetical protein